MYVGQKINSKESVLPVVDEKGNLKEDVVLKKLFASNFSHHQTSYVS